MSDLEIRKKKTMKIYRQLLTSSIQLNGYNMYKNEKRTWKTKVRASKNVKSLPSLYLQLFLKSLTQLLSEAPGQINKRVCLCCV